jgi:hypothetical protein
MTQNEMIFINQLDVMCESCRIRRSFIYKWRKLSLDAAIQQTKGLNNLQCEQLIKIAKDLKLL